MIEIGLVIAVVIAIAVWLAANPDQW